MTPAKQVLNQRAAQLHALKQQLPKLTFVPEVDCIWSKNELAQDYLNFYQINFSHTSTTLQHGFGHIEAAGFFIAVQYWLPKQAQGTLVIVHGYYDHVGLFGNAIRFALERNLAVLAFDLPGHGLSSGEPAVIDSFDQYADVLAELLKQSQGLLQQPLHALAQSTGCAVVLNYLWRHVASKSSPICFAKTILCAPLILARGWSVGQFVYAIVRYFIKRLPRGAANSSHEQHFNNFIMQEDPLQAKYLSLKWVGAMKAWNQQFCEFSASQNELLIIQGTGDMTINWHYNVPLIQRKLPHTKVVMIENAKHQLVNESEVYRTQVFNAAANYLSL